MKVQEYLKNRLEQILQSAISNIDTAIQAVNIGTKGNGMDHAANNSTIINLKKVEDGLYEAELFGMEILRRYPDGHVEYNIGNLQRVKTMLQEAGMHLGNAYLPEPDYLEELQMGDEGER